MKSDVELLLSMMRMPRVVDEVSYSMKEEISLALVLCSSTNIPGGGVLGQWLSPFYP